MMTEKSPNRLVYYVGDSYTSFGYAWIWTTVLCDTDRQGFQALYPDEQQAIIESEDLEAVVDKILNDEFSMEINVHKEVAQWGIGL